MTSQRERAAWTEYAEMRQRQRNQTAKRQRKSENPNFENSDLERALDDVVDEAGQRRAKPPAPGRRRGAVRARD
jgi:hypothetical protein